MTGSLRLLTAGVVTAAVAHVVAAVRVGIRPPDRRVMAGYVNCRRIRSMSRS